MESQSQLVLELGDTYSIKVKDMPDPRMNAIDQHVYFLPIMERMRNNLKRYKNGREAELAAKILKIAVEDGLYIQTKPLADTPNERYWSDKLLYAPDAKAYEYLDFLCHFCEENPDKLIAEYRRSKHYIHDEFREFFNKNKYLKYIYA